MQDDKSCDVPSLTHTATSANCRCLMCLVQAISNPSEEASSGHWFSVQHTTVMISVQHTTVMKRLSYLELCPWLIGNDSSQSGPRLKAVHRNGL